MSLAIHPLGAIPVGLLQVIVSVIASIGLLAVIRLAASITQNGLLCRLDQACPGPLDLLLTTIPLGRVSDNVRLMLLLGLLFVVLVACSALLVIVASFFPA